MTMMSMQMGGLVMSLVGWVGSILTCALPLWKVTTFIGSNIGAAQVCSEGLWQSCVYENSGQMQCKGYDSLLDLNSDLQSSRMMVVTSLFVAFFGFLISVTSFTRFMDDSGTKTRYLMVSGALFIVAGILILIPVSWVADNIVNRFYNPMMPETLKRELGAALYIGWFSSFLEIIGGIILCRSGSQSQEDSYSRKYRGVKTSGQMGYPMKDYV